MKKRYAVFGAAAVVVFGAAYYWYAPVSYSEAATIAEGARDFEELRGRFQKLAEGKGGEYAFEVLRRAPLPPNTDLHMLGHAVGDVLYADEGVSAITLCTQDFRNACSHSIVIGAFLDFGEDAFDEIRDACKKAPGGSGAYTMCYHGLGHGIFASFKYSIPETIDFCAKTGTDGYRKREYIECFGGAIMELTGGGGHDREAWLDARAKYFTDDPLSPCTSSVVSDDVKEICLTYLTPQLWEIAGIDIGNPEPGLFPKAFSYCDRLPKGAAGLRRACYGGFGKEFIPLVAARDIRDNATYTDEQLATVARWCRLAGNDAGADYCIQDALASTFWGGEKDPSISFRLCANAGGLGDACYARLGEDIAMYTEDERRASLCARLPQEARAACDK